MHAFELGREPAELKRTYSEVWRLGENLADDRFDITREKTDDGTLRWSTTTCARRPRTR